jgi:hypothetical protein
MSFATVERNVERHTGLSVEDIRRYSPERLRAFFAHQNKRPVRIISEFPVIGRGNVLRDGLMDTETINGDIDTILDDYYDGR